ncbi:unnamed protein product [Rhizophagus irregularis]|nr:unnamed protein product [Rhizophagus irregularis]
MWRSDDSYENKMEFLTVHDYDGHIQNQQELRSMKNSKLIDFILHPLHNTKDYIESANILFTTFEKIEQEDYLNNFIIPKFVIGLAKIIDIERNDKGFKDAFVNTRNTNISKVKLISLEKKVSLFLLSLFDKIYHNIGRTKNNGNETFEFPSFNNRIVNVKVLPLAWSTLNPPAEDKFCDADNCNITNSLSNIVLIYDDLDEDYEDENIEALLEQTEQDMDNQYEIQYNIWLNYNNV